jgi:uncharacterized C2H2 Zn-finger protein
MTSLTWLDGDDVPVPDKGGTYLRCPADGCKFRTRRQKRYRRHWRHRHLE